MEGSAAAATAQPRTRSRRTCSALARSREYSSSLMVPAWRRSSSRKSWSFKASKLLAVARSNEASDLPLLEGEVSADFATLTGARCGSSTDCWAGRFGPATVTEIGFFQRRTAVKKNNTQKPPTSHHLYGSRRPGID